MNLRRAAQAVVVIALATVGGGHAGPGWDLPIFVADNHAGSFGFFARTVDLDEPHVLVLVDAHSDASAVGRSDEVRSVVRRVRSEDERRVRIDELRASGRLQACNWIEPLMPRPVERVVWVAGWNLDLATRSRLEAEARASVDGRLGFDARTVGSLGDRWTVVDADGFDDWRPGELPVLASIDLDAFAGMTEAEARSKFRAIWLRILGLPRLRAVSFAVSRAWLKDDDEAFRLLTMALTAADRVSGGAISFEPHARVGPDDSKRAAALIAGGRAVPRLDFAVAPVSFREFAVARADDWRIGRDPERWRDLLGRWKSEAARWEIRPERG